MTSSIEVTRTNGTTAVQPLSGLCVPSNLSIRRLVAPLELTTGDGNQVVIHNPPDQVINFEIGPIISVIKELVSLVKSSGGGIDDGGGKGGSGDGDKVTVTVEGGKGKVITVTIK